MSAAAASPGAHGDGFTYPGNSREAARYEREWDAQMRRLPPAPTGGDPALAQLDWMVGRWAARIRDFPPGMTDPAAAETGRESEASIGWTVGRRWLRIAFVAEPVHAERSYYLGHDPVGRRWVLHALAAPWQVFGGPALSTGWTNDRMVFAPTPESYKGFRDVHRFVLVRTGRDSFRIVSEIRMKSGRFVAMDDVLFTRRGEAP